VVNGSVSLEEENLWDTIYVRLVQRYSDSGDVFEAWYEEDPERIRDASYKIPIESPLVPLSDCNRSTTIDIQIARPVLLQDLHLGGAQGIPRSYKSEAWIQSSQ